MGEFVLDSKEPPAQCRKKKESFLSNGGDNSCRVGSSDYVNTFYSYS